MNTLNLMNLILFRFLVDFIGLKKQIFYEKKEKKEIIIFPLSNYFTIF